MYWASIETIEILSMLSSKALDIAASLMGKNLTLLDTWLILQVWFQCPLDDILTYPMPFQWYFDVYDASTVQRIQTRSSMTVQRTRRTVHGQPPCGQQEGEGEQKWERFAELHHASPQRLAEAHRSVHVQGRNRNRRSEQLVFFHFHQWCCSTL